MAELAGLPMLPGKPTPLPIPLHEAPEEIRPKAPPEKSSAASDGPAGRDEPGSKTEKKSRAITIIAILVALAIALGVLALIVSYGQV